MSTIKSGVIRKGSRVSPDGLVRYITNGLRKSEPRKSRGKLYAGDASYCPRKSTLFATREGVNELTAAGLLYMETGTVIHRLFQKGLEASGILVEAERRISLMFGELQLSGMVDGILLVDDEHKILEIKTCGALPSAPKKEHLHQALTYALVTGIYKIVIFYQSRSVASWDGKLTCVEFEYDVTPIQLDMIAEILATSFVATKHKVIPPIPGHIKSQHDCGFCPFTAICWGPAAEKFKKLSSRIEDEIQATKLDLLKMSKKAHKEYA